MVLFLVSIMFLVIGSLMCYVSMPLKATKKALSFGLSVIGSVSVLLGGLYGCISIVGLLTNL